MRRRTAILISSVLLLAALTALAGQVVYKGNSKSKKFHGPNCRYYNAKNVTVVFNSREAAIRAGYEPCKVCKP